MSLTSVKGMPISDKTVIDMNLSDVLGKSATVSAWNVST